MQVIAPGAIVLIRDETWRVQRVQRTSGGETAMYVTGVSELVRDKEAIFIKELEERPLGNERPRVEVLDPSETDLVLDESSGYRNSLLYMESLLRRMPPTDDDLHIGHRAAMDPLDYQLQPALSALEKPRQRILVADAVGLGKTLECGILLSELIRRGRGRRILVVAIKSMLAQFQKELWTRFTIPLVRLDSVGLQRIRQHLPTNQNPFHYFDKTIISVDTLKQNNEYRTHLENAEWDIIVIDEAHNVAARGDKRSQRAAVAELLAHRSDTLIMLSATPHDGKPESFASLMNMLDPTAIADPSNYTRDDIDGLFIRRFKKDIETQVGANFPKREVMKAYAAANAVEEDAFDALINLEFSEIDQRQGAHILFRTTLEKALLSSPAACIKTIDNRLHRIQRDDPERFEADAAALSNLRHAIEAIGPTEFSKYQRLLTLLKDDDVFRFTGHQRRDRLVIFTERVETMCWLHERLIEDLAIDEKKVQMLHGSLPDKDQQAVVEAFGQEKSDIRLLIATDVASEGINLHYQCHRMVHFDIPWSLMVFRQRNGRIDRYGQTDTPYILYLYTESENARLRGDTRVLELLIDKDEQATANIGDPSALLGVYDVDAETRITASVIQGETSFDAFQAQLNQNDFDPLEFMLRKPAPEPQRSSRTHDPSTLFPSNYAYLREATRALEIEVEDEPDRKLLRLNMPDDLVDRFDLLPNEIRPVDKVVILSEDKNEIASAIADARSEESAWPAVHYLWELNPVVGWVNDRMTSLFGRHAAPVIHLDSLAPDETVFVVSGLIPNRKSQPVVHHWFGVVFSDDQVTRVESFDETRSRLALGDQTLINDGRQRATEHLTRRLPIAVRHAQRQIIDLHHKHRDALQSKLDTELEKLGALEKRQLDHLDAQYRTKTGERARLEREAAKRRIEQTFEEFVNWVEETMTTEDHPFIQIIAVLEAR